MLIETHHISKTFDGHSVLSDISFAIKKGERVGIVGSNGSGKTTLLKLLAGIEQPDNGHISITTDATIGYVPQAPDYDDAQTVSDILMPLVREWETHRIDKALDVLGIIDCKKKLFGELSSGQKTRVYLVRIVVEACDVLLLDEPTNHLDIHALEWLEKYLQDYNGTVCVVSHDRVFLDNITDRIFELSDEMMKEYGGNYSFYKEQKKIEREAHARAYVAQQKNIKRLKATARDVKIDAEHTAADRRPKRDKEKQAAAFFAERAGQKKSAAAKNIEQRLETIEDLEKPQMDPQLKVLFSPQKRGSQIIARFENVEYTTPRAKILSDASFTIERGDRVILSGANGAGKTTLVKLILGQLQPKSGKASLGQSVKVGYLSQEHESLEGTHTVLSELVEKTGIDQTLAHRLLAWLLVPREKMNQAVNTLSKGEQSKILLAEIIASGAHFIVLDEPTNHLDIASREAVEAALREYQGTLLIISHDRYFIEAVGATRCLHLQDGELKQL